MSCAGGAHSNEDDQDYDDNDGKNEDSDDDNSDDDDARMRTLTMTTAMMRTIANLIMLPVMTRSLMTMTANVICILIPNSLIVCYWKMKNPLNPIM